MNNMEVAKITVTDIGGTYRDVADAARTTIGLKEGKKEISESYMYKMWKKKGVEIMKIKLKGPIDNYCQRCLEVRNMETVKENVNIIEEGYKLILLFMRR